MADELKCPKCGDKVVIGYQRNSDAIALKCMKLRMGCDYYKMSTEKDVEAAGRDLKKLDPPRRLP